VLQKIKDSIMSNETFVVTTHNSPDGDAIGSLLSMGELLEKLNKKVYYYCKDPVPYFLTFLPNTNKIKSDLNGIVDLDVLIALDCGEYHRIGKKVRK
jgi:phosphoesterase RecJ-like protein